MFTLALLTVPRARAFIHQTIASLIHADERLAELLPIYFFVDSDDTHFLQRYKKISVTIPLGAPELEIRKKWTDVRLAVLYNYWRCLHHFRDATQPLLVCEDDIAFAPHWIQTLLPLLDRIRADVGDSYILTLYSPYNWPQVLGNDQTPYTPMKKEGFYGTQAVLFSPPARLIVEDYLWREGIERLIVPADLRIRDCCIERNIPLVTLTHSLVQHEGYITSGCTGEPGARGFAHRSPTFPQS